MGWFKALFEKDDWRLVGTLEMGIVETNPIRNDKTTGTLYYYLYENQHGERKFDIADTIRGEYELDTLPKTDIAYRSAEYMEKVKPWLGGRKVTGITSYAKAPMHDFKHRLENGE